ncbi:cysteine desulfurase family protein [Streptomyces roseus]|uniref:cysteine desulfurase n=1 Tax=Streptomyces roseus TaxID=66430 RepID=A0A0J6XP43_9ACTN|nr:cysteine desulfurase family protein [Streptomyces roseus]KMO96012.1 aminotransferase [Streptomyces roseus]
MTSRPIYLDHQATTPLDPQVLEEMLPYLTTAYGNPNSAHAYGREAAKAVAEARRRVAHLIGAKNPVEVVFTSGATEANHLAIVGGALAKRPHGGHIVTTAIEHKAVLAAVQRLVDHHGYTATRVAVDEHGRVHPGDVAAALISNTVLVSVMHANNEIGTLQRIAVISQLTAHRGVLLHTDAAQSAGYGLFDAEELGVDLASLSAHKLYGPKGIGALYVRGGTLLTAQQTGGGQERGLRSGTLNVPAIVGFGAAAQLITSDATPALTQIRALRDRLQDQLLDAIAGATVNGHPTRRLPGTLSLTLPDAEAADVLGYLPDVAAATGSACNSGTSEPSHVLTAIGLTRTQARRTLRLGVGRTTTAAEVERAAALIAQAAAHPHCRAPHDGGAHPPQNHGL